MSVRLSVMVMSASPDKYDFSKLSKLVQQFIYECIIEIVFRTRGAQRHQDSAIWRPLQGDDLLVDLVPGLGVHLQDVHIHYGHHRPREGQVRYRNLMLYERETLYICSRVWD